MFVVLPLSNEGLFQCLKESNECPFGRTCCQLTEPENARMTSRAFKHFVST